MSGTTIEKNPMGAILGQAKALGIIGQLCSCLDALGTNLMSGSCNSALAVAEACKALWLLIDAFNLPSGIVQKCVFPLKCTQSLCSQVVGSQRSILRAKS